MLVFWAAVALSRTKCLTWGLAENNWKSSSVGGVLPTGAVSIVLGLRRLYAGGAKTNSYVRLLASVGFMPAGPRLTATDGKAILL